MKQEVENISMQVKPGFMNPLAMMKTHGLGMGENQGAKDTQNGKDKVKELQMRRQQIESEMLLMRATGADGNGNSVKKMEKMETKLDKVTEELKAAKTDSYEKDKGSRESAGIYEVKEKQGRRMVTMKR